MGGGQNRHWFPSPKFLDLSLVSKTATGGSSQRVLECIDVGLAGREIEHMRDDVMWLLSVGLSAKFQYRQRIYTETNETST